MEISKLGSLSPHRLPFLAGVTNLVLAMAWWTLYLLNLRNQWFEWPAGTIHPGWLHATVMQYQMLPSFIFGFLFTVFPRWMKLPDLSLRQILPCMLALLLAQFLTLAGTFIGPRTVTVGLMLGAVAWLWALLLLGRVLVAEQGVTWHARSCYLALWFGMAGLACFLAYCLGGDLRLAFASIKIGTFAFLLPIFLTVAHRMFPFFSASALAGYKAWRPMWLLVLAWPLLLLHLMGELSHAYRWLWVVDLPLAIGSGLVLYRWWPRQPMPPLLLVLFLGFSWLPFTFLLYALQNMVYWQSGDFVLGRAPAHALFVGFFGSIVVAMVTRVTQGHSGRPLQLPPVAVYAFAGIQLVTVTRLVAEVAPNTIGWMIAASAGWLLVLLPWAWRTGKLVTSPRIDGKPG